MERGEDGEHFLHEAGATIEYGDAHAVTTLIPMSPFAAHLPTPPPEERVPHSPFSSWGAGFLAECTALDSLAAAAALAASVLGPVEGASVGSSLSLGEDHSAPPSPPELVLPLQSAAAAAAAAAAVELTTPSPPPPRDALVCPDCSVVFVQKLWLLGHRHDEHGTLAVNDREILMCEHCPAGFLRKTDRTKHTMCVHERRRPHKCEVDGCGSCFFFAKDLKKHGEAVHLRIKPYPCAQCGKRFGKKEHRTCHVRRVHDKLRPFRCEDCSTNFATKYNMRGHLKTAVHRKAVADKATANGAPASPT